MKRSSAAFKHIIIIHLLQVNNSIIRINRQELHWSHFWHGRNAKFKIKRISCLRRKIRKNVITNLANNSAFPVEKCSGKFILHLSHGIQFVTNILTFQFQPGAGRRWSDRRR